MKNIAHKLFLGLEIFLCVLLTIQSFRFWIEPLRWGWPDEMRLRGFILLLFSFTLLIFSIGLLKTSRLTLGTKISFLLGAILVTIGVGSFIMSFLPIPPGIYEILEQEDYHPQEVFQLADCEKVDKFITIGYRRLDMGNRIVLVPAWLHSSLETIPKGMLVDCFTNLILEQEKLIKSADQYNEEPIRKLHALVFEARRLNILDHPELSDRLQAVSCNKAIDLFGKLVIETYIVNTGKLPSYDYYSAEGKVRLYEETCQ